ncbi:MAG: zinc metallopeptidase [Muribaculaceae bacterium]|nr:zinc metallopeptidase [Muribaculaceae bacterium]
MYLVLFIVVGLMSYFVQRNLSKKFERYSRCPMRNGMTGSDVAQRMLSDNGIRATIRPVSGTLTDFFNPADMSVNLSEAVYGSNSIAAAAVAAHECGHAVQHQTRYSMLVLRTKLVPAVSFASKWVSWVLLGGILLIESFPQLLAIGIGLFAITTLFSFVTLPVEIDASRRAIKWLEASGITQGEDTEAAKDALHAAAYTYVAAALGSLATLIYYVFMLLGRRD